MNLPIPSTRYIRKLPNGFQVIFTFGKYKKPLSKLFSFKKYGGVQSAHEAARLWRDEQITTNPQLTEIKEWIDKYKSKVIKRPRTTYKRTSSGVMRVYPFVRKGRAFDTVCWKARNRKPYGQGYASAEYNVIRYGWLGAFKRAVKKESELRGVKFTGRYPSVPDPQCKILEALNALVLKGYLDDAFNPTAIAQAHMKKFKGGTQAPA